MNRKAIPRHSLTRAELEALRAVGRGATELKMPSRVQARLLELGLIQRPGRSLGVTQAGLRVLSPRMTRWL